MSYPCPPGADWCSQSNVVTNLGLQVIEGARDIVARLRPQDQRGAAHGKGSVAPPRLAPSEDLGVVCVAHHWWDVCRMKDWGNTKTARNVQGNGSPGREPNPIATFQAHHPAASPADEGNSSHSQTWLAHVELSTCKDLDCHNAVHPEPASLSNSLLVTHWHRVRGVCKRALPPNRLSTPERTVWLTRSRSLRLPSLARRPSAAPPAVDGSAVHFPALR